MKYFKVFNTESEYLAYISSKDFISPNVSTLRDCTNTWINAEVHDYSKDYFTIESLEDNNEIKLYRGIGGGKMDTLNIAASTDGGSTWTEFELDGSIENTTDITTLNQGEKVMFKYLSGATSREDFSHTRIVSTASFNVYGNVMSFVSAGDFTTATTLYWYNRPLRLLQESKVISAENLVLPATTLASGSYRSMFDGCTLLTTVPSALPATTLATRCYYSMFKDCTSLTETLELPATTLANECYMEMFKGCTSLTATTELTATTMYTDCYRSMFDGCTSLTTTPELPATTLATRCYRSMFGNCTNLEEAPELPVKTLADDCYRYMFGGCTSLTEAPELPATTLATYCYYQMFYGCTSLTTAPELPATTLPNAGYCGMFSCCTSLTTAPIISATTIGTSGCADMFASCSSLTTVQNTLPATTLANNCYYRMFHSCSELTTAPELPATTLADWCYANMFFGCSSLTTVPDTLPATTLANNCYREMFRGCNSLTTAPIISATTLANQCCMEMFRDCQLLTTVQSELPATTMAASAYTRMFYSCNSLTTAPTLPATTLANGCYDGTFQHCIALTTVQNILPATTLVERCYIDMFRDCWALPTAPELPATTLFEKSYKEMFMNCNNLNYIKCLATDINATECTIYWVKSVASSGTFVKNSLMENWTTGNNGIPTNWTVRNDTYIEVTGVTISASAATVNKGNTYTLTASVLPSNADDKVVSWSTSDSSVATVSNGVVTGVGCGNATITVTTHEKGYTATCSISVENHVTSVDLDAYQLYLSSGGTYQLEVTVLPSDACNTAVTWSSSDVTIATVDSNGLVSGVTTGDAVVTVTSVDNSSATKNCSVTVNPPTHATGVTLSDSAITINKDESYTLTATVLPIDAIDKSVTWSSSDGSIATVDSNGVVSGVASGDATVTVRTTDGGLTAQCSVSVTNTHDYSKDYFTIESLEDNNEIKIQKVNGVILTIQYSLDDGVNWSNVTNTSAGATIATLDNGEKVILKGNVTTYATAYDKYNHFIGSKTFKVYGNVMSLINGDNFTSNSEFSAGTTFNLCGLFYNSTNLVDAYNLVLPASACTDSCYNGMFRGCTNLSVGPSILPATEPEHDCYSSMFEGCINLETAPEISLTSMALTCCMRMFCMDRYSKITTPKMTKSPILRCNTAAADCYKEMFKGNGNLNEITCLLTTSTGGAANWVKYAGAATGTFYKSPLKNDWPYNDSGVPTGWTIVDYEEE